MIRLLKCVKFNFLQVGAAVGRMAITERFCFAGLAIFLAIFLGNCSFWAELRTIDLRRYWIQNWRIIIMEDVAGTGLGCIGCKCGGLEFASDGLLIVGGHIVC